MHIFIEESNKRAVENSLNFKLSPLNSILSPFNSKLSLSNSILSPSNSKLSHFKLSPLNFNPCVISV